MQISRDFFMFFAVFTFLLLFDVFQCWGLKSISRPSGIFPGGEFLNLIWFCLFSPLFTQHSVESTALGFLIAIDLMGECVWFEGNAHGSGRNVWNFIRFCFCERKSELIGKRFENFDEISPGNIEESWRDWNENILWNFSSTGSIRKLLDTKVNGLEVSTSA